MRTLHKFHGGIHPPSHKAQSTQKHIRGLPLPDRLIIAFQQHAGEIAKPVVQVGDRVKKGQLIALPDGYISGAIHAPTSGTIIAIDKQNIAHASGMADLCATLIPDGKDEWIELEKLDYIKLHPDQLREKVRMAGVVGLGGATFPSDIKLKAGERKLKTLILNGAECEPYITCDDMIMRERAEQIVRGAELIRYILDAEEIVLGIEDNKPEAQKAIEQASKKCGIDIEVVAVPTIYPGGGVKQMIRVLTGLEVPSGKLPVDIGVQCFNVATCFSIWRAITHGEPLISRIVTVTGNVENPQNVEVLIGTPVDKLVAYAKELPDTNGYIMGGPMMGVRLSSDSIPVMKGSNCIIATSEKLFPAIPSALPCIRCTRCVTVCPVSLQPHDLYWYSKGKEFGKAQTFSLFDCIECGACSYVCPSHIPLVQYFRYAKSEIRIRALEKQNADKARERHEFREYRLEREKQEKAEKLAAKEKAAQQAKDQAQKAKETESLNIANMGMEGQPVPKQPEVAQSKE